MGNVALRITCTRISIAEDGSTIKKVVTVLKQDGSVLEFARQLRVSKLLKDFPGHFVCNSEEVGSGGKASMLSPNTLLQRGKVYLVLFHNQINQNSSRRCGTKSSKILPLVPPAESGHQMTEEFPQVDDDDDEAADNSKRCQRIRLVMTKQQLAKMLSDGSILVAASNSCKAVPSSLQILNTRLDRPGLSHCSMRLFNHPVNMRITCVRAKRTWCPELDSIVEVPSQ